MNSHKDDKQPTAPPNVGVSNNKQPAASPVVEIKDNKRNLPTATLNQLSSTATNKDSDDKKKELLKIADMMKIKEIEVQSIEVYMIQHKIFTSTNNMRIINNTIHYDSINAALKFLSDEEILHHQYVFDCIMRDPAYSPVIAIALCALHRSNLLNQINCYFLNTFHAIQVAKLAAQDQKALDDSSFAKILAKPPLSPQSPIQKRHIPILSDEGLEVMEKTGCRLM